MAFFEWAADMEVDRGGPIDADHRRLVDLVNRLHDHTTQGRGQEVVAEVIDQLIGYTKDHLRREEDLLQRSGYPADATARHKAGHDRFVERLIELKRAFDQGSIIVAAQLSTTLRDWLSLHIRRADKDIHRHLRASGQLA